jgi:DNA-binding response OmpR family regulator/predicted Ser/Thr protein kinase
MNLDPKAKNIEIYIDLEKFANLLSNLLSNSFKFTKQGFIEVSTQVTDDSFVLIVSDSGIGIKEDQLPYIFDRFRQADGSASREYAGTGIGLALVKEVTDLHGGTVTVHSEYRKGTSFRLTIPIGKNHIDPKFLNNLSLNEIQEKEPRIISLVKTASLPENVDEINQQTENSLDLKKPTILYAEDNSDLRTHVRDLLADDYNVFLAVDGHSALENIARFKPDLLISDFMMPKMSGFELLQKIRKDPEFHRLPIILLTARAGSEARIECLNAGADDYITKPFDSGELRARIRNLLNSASQEKELIDLNYKLNCRIEEQMAELIRTGKLRNFLPQAVAEKVLAGNIGEVEHFDRRKVTILFVDLPAFATLFDRLEPEELTEVMNQYLAEMSAAAIKHSGTFDRFMGERLMITFGAPAMLSLEDQSKMAIDTAFDMQTSLATLTSKWRTFGVADEMVKLRIAINTGYCTAGVFGNELMKTYTVVGAPVNVAHHLLTHSEPGKIVVTLSTFALIEKFVQVGPRKEIMFGDSSKPLDYYEVEFSSEQKSEIDPESSKSDRLFHYRILQQLGAGGMGEVYEARDLTLGRSVALKILPKNFISVAERKRRFLKEAKAASALNHPNICTIYEAGITPDDRPYIAMEHIQGQTLEECFKKSVPTSEKVVEIAIQLADALEEAHNQGIIHRDIKAPNIMITRRGQVKILDFGIAKIKSLKDNSDEIETETRDGIILGTVHYMSPEQIRGLPIDHRSDIFSTGVLLYKLLTGQLPFVGATATDILYQILNSQPQPIAHLNTKSSAELEGIVKKCMEKQPESRYQSMAEFLADLKSLKRNLDGASLS